MFEPALAKIIDQLRPEIAAWPRRVPGQLLIGDKVIRYADLHSFYYQAIQIFKQNLYGFTCSRPDPVILDCGAHVGLASIYFKLRYPAARVTAFEADPIIAEMARRNLDALGWPDVNVDPRAVWIDNKGVSFSHSADDSGHVTASATDAAMLPSIRLRDALAAGPVDLVKLDIEGAEFRVIEDCGDMLGNVGRMILEVHKLESDWPRFGALIDRLESSGFRIGFHDLQQARWVAGAEKPPFSALATDRMLISVYAWR